MRLPRLPRLPISRRRHETRCHEAYQCGCRDESFLRDAELDNARSELRREREVRVEYVEALHGARRERDAAQARVAELEQAVRSYCDPTSREDRGTAKRRLCAVLDGDDRQEPDSLPAVPAGFHTLNGSPCRCCGGPCRKVVQPSSDPPRGHGSDTSKTSAEVDPPSESGATRHPGGRR